MNALCIYHQNCLDGFAAAWVVGKFFGFDHVDFHAADYGSPVPDLKDRDVILVDFSYKPEALLPAMAEAKSVTILDHHKSALEDWAEVRAPNLHKVLDMEHSGAVLAWQQYFPSQEIPKLFLHLQDYDLWQKRFPESNPIVAALYARGFIREQHWYGIGALVDFPVNWGALVDEGNIVQRANMTTIRNILRRSTRVVRFMGHTVPLAPMPKELASLAGEILYKAMYPFAVTYDDWLADGLRVFSLRSDKVHGADVQAIARSLGGGGHVNAAGFTVPLNMNLGTYISFPSP